MRPFPLPSRECKPDLPGAPAVKLNGNRHITGTLRGFDQFMNLVIDETVEQVRQPSFKNPSHGGTTSTAACQVSPTENNKIGMVVRRVA